MGNKYLTPTPIHKSLLFSEIYLFKSDDKTRKLIFDSQLFLFLGTIFSVIYSAHEIHPSRFQKLSGLLDIKFINIRVLYFEFLVRNKDVIRCLQSPLLLLLTQ